MRTTLRKPIYWKTTELAHQKAKSSMNFRAKNEKDKIKKGERIDIVHEQAVRDYYYIKELINIGIKFLRMIGSEVKGIILDLGSGTGVGASILSTHTEFSQIIAVEISENFVNQIMPLVFKNFGANTEIIQRVVGDFNHIEMEDNSVDAIIEIDSFHHSENLTFTLKECYRVLRNGGVMICIDRGWSNRFSQDELEDKLDTQLNENLKRKYNIPLKKKFTRRDFGEHEYTLKQWKAYFYKARFKIDFFSQWHPPFFNSVLLKLPIQKIFIMIAIIQHYLGIRQHLIYGFNSNRRLFVCIK